MISTNNRTVLDKCVVNLRIIICNFENLKRKQNFISTYTSLIQILMKTEIISDLTQDILVVLFFCTEDDKVRKSLNSKDFIKKLLFLAT